MNDSSSLWPTDDDVWVNVRLARQEALMCAGCGTMVPDAELAKQLHMAWHEALAGVRS